MTNIALNFVLCYICHLTLTLRCSYSYFIQNGGSDLSNKYICVKLFIPNLFILLQLSQELQFISLHVDAVHTLSYIDKHGELVNPLFNIDKAAAQLLQWADKCMKRFSEAIVLYDS